MSRKRTMIAALVLITIVHLLLVRLVSPHMAIAWFELPMLAALWLLNRQGRIGPELPLCHSTACAFLLMEPGVGLGYLSWFGVIPLFMLMDAERRPLRLAAWGMWTGFIIATGIFAWVLESMESFFGFSLARAFPLFTIVVVLIGMQHAIFLPLASILARRSRLPLAIMAAIVYPIVEYWMPLPFSIALVLAYTNQPLLMQSLDLAGPQGVCLLILLINGCLYVCWSAGFRTRAGRTWLLSAILLFVFQIGYSTIAWFRHDPSRSAMKADIALIQPIGPLRVMNDDLELQQETAGRLRRLSLEAVRSQDSPPDLLVWPEGAAHFSASTPQFNPPYGGAVRDIQTATSTTLLVQDIEFFRDADNARIRYYSTATVIAPDGGVADRSRKNILMPFGEYIPMERQLPFLRRFFTQSRSIAAGTRVDVLETPAGSIVPVICYEILFGDFVRTATTAESGIIVNLTNDRWYGTRQQPIQHQAFARMRAIENRRPIVRATNSGISALIDARGHIPADHQTNVMEETWLRGPVAQGHGRTLYSRIGDLLPRWILPVVLLLALLYAYSPGRHFRTENPTSLPRSRQASQKSHNFNN